MPNYNVIEIKTFVPSKNFELSKVFYADIGFDMGWCSNDMAYFCAGESSFLLQDFYVKEQADNFMMSLLVESADDWWARIDSKQISSKYSIEIGVPEDREWGLRDFTLIDPSGVLWRIGHNINME